MTEVVVEAFVIVGDDQYVGRTVVQVDDDGGYGVDGYGVVPYG